MDRACDDSFFDLETSTQYMSLELHGTEDQKPLTCLRTDDDRSTQRPNSAIISQFSFLIENPVPYTGMNAVGSVILMFSSRHPGFSTSQ